MKSLTPLQRSRLQLIGIFLLFGVPIVLSTWLALSGSWRPAGSAHHGELLDPALSLSELPLQQPDGTPLTLDDLRGRWTVVYFSPEPGCADICQERLYYMRQIRHALGRHMGRVRNLLVLEQTPDETLGDWLGEQHPGMLIAQGDAALRTEFATPFMTHADETHWIYIIDPLGNLVMRYGRDVEPDGILNDIERLLKYSKIG